jgi:transglutaminase-like putative cysteine protease
MLVEISHQNMFEYAEPVSETHLEFRMTPLTDGRQHLLLHRTRVAPQRRVRDYVDVWGNTVSYLNLLEPLTRLVVSCDSVVETFGDGRHETEVPDGPAAPGEIYPGSPTGRLMLHDYLQPTELTPWSEEFSLYIRPLERLRGAPAREAAAALCEAIHQDFQYEKGVTSSSSPITEALRLRAGVSQDFAHLMLAACRYLGFPARYVSGYVLLEPGREGASHAWCQVFDPEEGWFGVDPTGNRWADERYVRLGSGRDYADVPPNRGIFRGTKVERLEVRVRVNLITANELEARTRALFEPPHAGARSGRGGRGAATSHTGQSFVAHQQQQQQGQG